jgi:hypothetical protein
MPALEIRGIRTMNQDHINATLFASHLEALALVMDCFASADLLELPDPKFTAYFQLRSPRTDSVVVNEVWWLGNLAWGQNFWISMGNNWGPAPSDWDTPVDWGIHPSSHGQNEVFGFRGIIQAYSWQEGLQVVDAFDVSETRWFRVRPMYTL